MKIVYTVHNRTKNGESVKEYRSEMYKLLRLNIQREKKWKKCKTTLIKCMKTGSKKKKNQ